MATATTSGSKVEPWQRFTKRTQDCPICGGNQDDRRGRGIRCWGYLSKDERYAHCTERAGDLQQRTDGTYKHRLDDSCWCNGSHETVANVRPTPIRKETTAPRLQHGPFPKELDGATLVYDYVYQRADHSPSYSVLRYEYPLQPGQVKPAKTFKQATHLDATSWAWGLRETERLLFRLPELLAAPLSRPVFIGEGEKVAKALIALGLVGTTCPEGAEKWLQVPGRHDALRGRHVVILPDRDEKGTAHAQQIAADLQGVAASVRIVALPGLPEHGDAVEWLADGGTKDVLYELVIATPVMEQQTTATPESAQQEAEAQEQAAREDALKAANVRMNDRVRWPERVNALPETHLKKSEAKVAIALRHLVEARRRTPPEAGGDTQVTLPELALAAGVGKSTASKATTALAEMRIFTKTKFYLLDKHGEQVECNAYNFGELVDAPEQWVPKDGPRAPRGGDREGAGAKPNVCRKCGGMQVQITEQDWIVTEQTTYCPDCDETTHRQVGPRRPAGPPRTVETQDSKGFPFEYSNGNGGGEADDGASAHHTSPHRTSEREQYGNGVVDEIPPCPVHGDVTYRQESLGWVICRTCCKRVDLAAS